MGTRQTVQGFVVDGEEELHEEVNRNQTNCRTIPVAHEEIEMPIPLIVDEKTLKGLGIRNCEAISIRMLSGNCGQYLWVTRVVGGSGEKYRNRTQRIIVIYRQPELMITF